jgi:hypothetical protein
MALAKLGDKPLGLWVKGRGDDIVIRTGRGVTSALANIVENDRAEAFSAAGINETLVRTARDYQMLNDPKAYLASKIKAEQELAARLDKQYLEDYQINLAITGDTVKAKKKAFGKMKGDWDYGMMQIQEAYPSIDKAVAALMVKRRAAEDSLEGYSSLN